VPVFFMVMDTMARLSTGLLYVGALWVLKIFNEPV